MRSYARFNGTLRVGKALSLCAGRSHAAQIRYFFRWFARVQAGAAYRPGVLFPDVRKLSMRVAIVPRQAVGDRDPRQLLGAVDMELRREIARILKAGGVEVDLVRPARAFESHRRS